MNCVKFCGSCHCCFIDVFMEIVIVKFIAIHLANQRNLINFAEQMRKEPI